MKASTENSKLIYDRFQTVQGIALPIFHQAWWLDIVSRKGIWKVNYCFDGEGKVNGVLPYYMTNYLLFDIIRTPPLTPFLGVWIDYSACSMKEVASNSHEIYVTEQLVKQIPKVLSYHQIHPHQFNNWLPFFWAGYEQTCRYTYVLDIENVQQVYTNLKSEVRTRIRKAEKLFQIVTTSDPNIFYEHYNKIMKYQGLSLKQYKTIFFNLHKEISNRGKGTIYLAINADNEIVAGLYMLLDTCSAHHWLAFMDKEKGAQGAAQLIIWHSVLDAAKTVKQYNFQGSMLKNVEPIFRNFGGKRMEMYQIRKFRNQMFRFLWWVLHGRKNRMV